MKTRERYYSQIPLWCTTLTEILKFQNDLIGIGQIKIPLKFLPQNSTNESKKMFSIPINAVQEKQKFSQIFENFIQNSPPHLRWVNFYRNGYNMAEVLMSVEMVEVNAPVLNVPMRSLERNENIPAEISPTMKKFR